MYSFQYAFISICIHLNVYSFEYIGIFSNFYLHICDKDCVTSLVWKNKNAQENQDY